jgi:histidyl-tRNA synthetase
VEGSLTHEYLLRAGIDPAVEKFKRDNKSKKEAIVEPNEREEGSKTGKAVSASEICLTLTGWEENQELAGFLRYLYQIKETINHKGYCTDAQSLMLLHDLMHNFCHPEAKLETLALPSTFKMEDRERFEEVKNMESVSTMIHNAHRVLKQELQARWFTLRSSNSRIVQQYTSKQMDAKGMLTNEQHELARTLYMQWLRKSQQHCATSDT